MEDEHRIKWAEPAVQNEEYVGEQRCHAHWQHRSLREGDGCHSRRPPRTHKGQRSPRASSGPLPLCYRSEFSRDELDMLLPNEVTGGRFRRYPVWIPVRLWLYLKRGRSFSHRRVIPAPRRAASLQLDAQPIGSSLACEGHRHRSSRNSFKEACPTLPYVSDKSN